MSECPDCGRAAKPTDLDRHGCCFRCKVTSISGFHFHGGGMLNNRAAFHDGSNREAEREVVEGARAAGEEIQRKRS